MNRVWCSGFADEVSDFQLFSLIDFLLKNKKIMLKQEK